MKNEQIQGFESNGIKPTVAVPNQIADIEGLQDALNGKQPTLTAGTNITIDANNVISASGGGSSSIQLSSNYEDDDKKITFDTSNQTFALYVKEGGQTPAQPQVSGNYIRESNVIYFQIDAGGVYQTIGAGTLIERMIIVYLGSIAILVDFYGGAF